MSFSSNMQNVADNLINKYGNDITLVHKYNCGYDPTIGEEVCDEDTFNIKGVIEAYSTSELSDNVLIDDLKVQIQEEMLIDASDWSVTYLSETWKIVNIITTTTQNKVVTQLLQIRT